MQRPYTTFGTLHVMAVVAIKYRRRRLVQCAVWIVIVAMGLSTLVIHNRGLIWSQGLNDISSYITSNGYFEDPSFAVPSTKREHNPQQQQNAQLSSLTKSKQKPPAGSTASPTNHTPPISKKLETTTAVKTFVPVQHSTSTQSTAESSSLSIQEKCFPHSSNRWIQGIKDSNHDEGMTLDSIETLLEAPRHFQKLSALFQETICHDNSPLKQVLEQSPPVPLEQRAEEWYQRFFYLAMHWKFHQPAVSEFQARKECWNDDNLRLQLQQFQKEHGIGNLDFECQDSKFVVSPIGHIGFGAFINTQVCLTILIALRTGRIPIFTIESLYPWQNGDTDPWLLAPLHCSRKDLQCYYMPTTPCALLLDDIRNATRYGSNQKEQRWLRKNLDIPPDMKQDHVVAINSGLQSKGKETLGIRTVAASIVQELMDEWIQQQEKEVTKLWSEEDWQAMQLAKKWMVDKADQDTTGLLRQMYVYFLRLNPHYKKVLKDRMDALIPGDFSPSNAVGVAIRGSDKCKKESTCLPFPRYMELMTDVVHPTLKGPSDTIRPRLIMTTEDPSIFNESLPFQQNTSFPYQFLVNDQDNMQGSGFPRDFKDQGEDTVVSTMTALQLHLSAGQVYLNCCSNFHAVISNLITAQCGAQRHGNKFPYNNLQNKMVLDESSLGISPVPTVVHCLTEENAVPRRFRICCGWYDQKDLTCNEIWKEHLQNREGFAEKVEKKRIG